MRLLKKLRQQRMGISCTINIMKNQYSEVLKYNAAATTGGITQKIIPITSFVLQLFLSGGSLPVPSVRAYAEETATSAEEKRATE